MKCLQCSKETNEIEYYNDIAIRICEDGHRTGEIPLEGELPLKNLNSIPLKDFRKAS